MTSRPPRCFDVVDRPGNASPDAVDDAIGLIRQELHVQDAFAEPFPDADTLTRERFGSPVLAVVCKRCDKPLALNHAGFVVHTEPTDCELPTVDVTEISS